MNVTLRQLRALVAVARNGSFTQAAESLHVTQSALSGLIKELESQLGVRLVDRSTRHIQLSEIGVEFHGMAARILRELDDALDNIDSLKHLRRGAVRIAAPQLMCSTLIPAIIAEFEQAYPEIEIFLTDCVVENIIKTVVDGGVDIGIGPQRSNSEMLAMEPFIAPRFITVFPAGHDLASQTQVRWRDLIRYPLITLKGQFTNQLEHDLFQMEGSQRLRPHHQVAFMSTVLSLVYEGVGVGVCMPYAQPLIDLYQLETRPLVEPVVQRRFFIYHRQHASLSPAADAFIQRLRIHADK